ncbi:MAG: hypothetical protein ABIQ11_08435 [Saprospiraceae bacterium]
MSPNAIPILLLAFFGCFSSPADAQINLKTGYNFSILLTDGLDQLISSINTSRSYDKPFSSIKWLHGLEAGLRWKGGTSALEITYQAAYKSTKASGVNGTEVFDDVLKLFIHSAALGYQYSDGLFGIGTDLQYQLYRTKFTNGLEANSFLHKQKMTALKFYLMLTLKGGKGVDMALQPYYVLPFDEYDLVPLAQDLQVVVSENQKLSRFGLTVLFYNGKK